LTEPWLSRYAPCSGSMPGFSDFRLFLPVSLSLYCVTAPCNEVGELIALCMYIVYSQDLFDFQGHLLLQGFGKVLRADSYRHLHVANARRGGRAAGLRPGRPGGARPAVNACPADAGLGSWTALANDHIIIMRVSPVFKHTISIKRCQYRKIYYVLTL